MTKEEAMRRYHSTTQHAEDGSPLAPIEGASITCNCEKVIDRLILMGIFTPS